MADRILTEVEWAVRHAAADMSRRGIFPTFDRLYECDDLAEYEERDVRAACNELVRLGKFPAPGESTADSHDAGLCTSRVCNKALNIALYRIVDDKGSVYESLAVVTGLSQTAIRSRVNTARDLYTSEELDPYSGRLSLAESCQVSRYAERYVERTGDPAVREFAAKVFAPYRARPDARSQTRDERAIS